MTIGMEPEKVKDVKRLLALSAGVDDVFKSALEGFTDPFYLDSWDASEEVVLAVIETIDTEEIEERIVQAYYQYFDQDEIKELIAFMESPTGRKWWGLTSELVEQVRDLIEEWMGEIETDVNEQVQMAKERIGYDSTFGQEEEEGERGESGGLLGAKQVLERFLSYYADHEALTMELRPTRDDYFAYFTDAVAESALERYEELWDSMEIEICPDEDRTELLIFEATVEELRSGTERSEAFPGGYARASQNIRDGITIYSFKFVSPGMDLGLAFDGLTYINGHWVLFPKPWRIVP